MNERASFWKPRAQWLGLNGVPFAPFSTAYNGVTLLATREGAPLTWSGYLRLQREPAANEPGPKHA